MPRFVSRPTVWTIALLVGGTLTWTSAARGQEELAEPEPEGERLLPADVESAELPVQEMSGEGDAGEDGTNEIAGATSTETVLRCVYRSHPSRLQAVYQFLKTNAAAGIDVSLRRADRVASEESPQLTDLPAGEPVDVFVAPADGERRAARPTFGDAPRGDGPLELVVVAPPEVQRALGQFLQLCVSAQPATHIGEPSTFGGEFDDFETSGRRAPGTDFRPVQDDFDTTPTFGKNPSPDFGAFPAFAPADPQPADARPVGDPFNDPTAFEPASPFFDGAAADDFGDPPTSD